MEHKVVTAASVIAALKIQHSPSKCKTNCLSLTKKLHQISIKAFWLCRWLCNNWRYTFRGTRQIVGGCNVHLQNELGRENWGVKPVRTNATYKSRAAAWTENPISPNLQTGTPLHVQLRDPWLSLDALSLDSDVLPQDHRTPASVWPGG